MHRSLRRQNINFSTVVHFTITV